MPVPTAIDGPRVLSEARVDCAGWRALSISERASVLERLGYGSDSSAFAAMDAHCRAVSETTDRPGRETTPPTREETPGESPGESSGVSGLALGVLGLVGTGIAYLVTRE